MFANVAGQTKVPNRASARTVMGRVLAWRESLLVLGAGLGPQYTIFVFGVENNSKTQLRPVKIAFAFFKTPPPDSFYDYSRTYELRAVRDPTCDERVDHLSYEETVDETGKRLPPRNVLRTVRGAPRNLLSPETVLPCYVVYDGYKTVPATGSK
jgi:hypothetical protein